VRTIVADWKEKTPLDAKSAVYGADEARSPRGDVSDALDVRAESDGGGTLAFAFSSS
jgi:hypothetical protein